MSELISDCGRASRVLREALLSEDKVRLKAAVSTAENIGVSAILLWNAQRKLVELEEAEAGVLGNVVGFTVGDEEAESSNLSVASGEQGAPLPPLPSQFDNRIADYDCGSFASSVELQNHAFQFPSLNGTPEDRTVFEALMTELEFHKCWLSTGMKFSRDICVVDDSLLAKSPTYSSLVERMPSFFGAKAVRSLANLYRDGNDWCNLHSDQYQTGGYSIDITIGCSFGDARRLVLVEKENKSHKIELPSRNGDVFAFSDHFNNTWQHMVPREGPECGPRISVIMWCSRELYQKDLEQSEIHGHSKLGSFPHMLYYNPKGQGNDFEARPSYGNGYPNRTAGQRVGGKGGWKADSGARVHESSRNGNFIRSASNGHSGTGNWETGTANASNGHSGSHDVDAALNVTTKAITLQGAQQVFAILRGKKLIENRSWKLPVGWYAIHAGSQHINEERKQRTLEAWPDAPPEETLPHSAIAGLFYVEQHRTPQQCKAGYIWARGPVCNVISKTVEFPRPIRCRGGQGLWDISDGIWRQMRSQLQETSVSYFDISVAVGTP